MIASYILVRPLTSSDLTGQKLLQGVGRAVPLDGPHFHLAEALASELGLAAQGLAGDEAVRARGPGVDLILHQMDELEDVHVADGDLSWKGSPGAAVVERDAAVVGRQVLLGPSFRLQGLLGLLDHPSDLGLRRAVEDRVDHLRC